MLDMLDMFAKPQSIYILFIFYLFFIYYSISHTQKSTISAKIMANKDESV